MSQGLRRIFPRGLAEKLSSGKCIRRIDKHDIRDILRPNAFRIKENSGEEMEVVLIA